MHRKHRMRGQYYTVYDIDTDELIIQGTVSQVCERLDITKSNVSRAVNKNQIVRRKYMIYCEEQKCT